MRYYVCRNYNDKKVCIVDRRPKWKKLYFDEQKQWLFAENGFWQTLDYDLFYHLTKIKVKEGKDGLVEIPKAKMKWILKL